MRMLGMCLLVGKNLCNLIWIWETNYSKTLNIHIIKPSDHTNRFAYLMNPKNGLLQWTDLLSNSIALNSIGHVAETSDNYHTYNKKVIYASIKKNSEGGCGNWLSNAFPFKKTKNTPFVWKSLPQTINCGINL